MGPDVGGAGSRAEASCFVLEEEFADNGFAEAVIVLAEKSDGRGYLSLPGYLRRPGEFGKRYVVA